MAPDWTQFLAQTRPGVVEIGPRGSLRDPEHAPDFRVLESFDVVQDDHGTLPLAQRGQGVTQTAPQFVRLTRIAKRRRDRVGEGIGVANLLAARDVQRGVRHDAMQPRAERLVRQEAIERAIRVEEPLLHRILRVLVREHDGAGNRVRAPLVQAHELSERLGLTALRRDDQGLLAFTRRVTRHGAHTSRRRKGVRDGEGKSGHVWVPWCPPENALAG